MDKKKTKKAAIDVGDMIDQAIVLGSSMVYLAKDGADMIVEELEKKELLSTKEGKKLADDIRGNFEDRKKSLHEKVKKHLKSIIDDLGIATKEDLKK
jgi:polyhydroxyalkanoate synthesis regulator phasin